MPWAHAEQAGDAKLGATEPAGHGVQAVARPSEEAPGWHGRQRLDWVFL